MWLAGCNLPAKYVEPLPAEPHATLKYRFKYHKHFDRSFQHQLLINNKYTAIPDINDFLVTNTGTLRIIPGNTNTKYSSEFFFTTSHQKAENVTEYYSCSSGGHSSTCTRTVTRYTTVTEHHTQAYCDTKFTFVVQEGRFYLVQFDFYGDKSCSYSCHEQVFHDQDDKFDLIPCEFPPPANADSK
jgi:hypothetical protein